MGTKKVVKTLAGDALPPVTNEYVDDSRNPFELDADELREQGVGTVQVYVEVAGTWVEVLYLSIPEQDGQHA